MTKEVFYKEICQLQKFVGYCKAAIPRFYYDIDRKSCELFHWGGCGPNANNFKTKKECEEKCVGLKVR